MKLKMPRAALRAGMFDNVTKEPGIEFYPEKPGIEVACHTTRYPKISCSSDVRSVPLPFT